MMAITHEQLTSSLVKTLMLSGQRHLENAEAVVQEKIMNQNPQTLGDLVGLLIDQLIVDLCSLDSDDVDLEDVIDDG